MKVEEEYKKVYEETVLTHILLQLQIPKLITSKVHPFIL